MSGEERALFVDEVFKQIRHEEKHEADVETHVSSCACCCEDCDVEEAEAS